MALFQTVVKKYTQTLVEKVALDYNLPPNELIIKYCTESYSRPDDPGPSKSIDERIYTILEEPDSPGGAIHRAKIEAMGMSLYEYYR